MSESPPRTLGTVQQWFQAVVTHPDGVEGGVASEEAQALIRLPRGEIEAVICRSRNLTAAERIGIYANAYYSRLLECVGDCFPLLRAALGEDVFNGFAFDYLQRYPSVATHWTTWERPSLASWRRPGRVPRTEDRRRERSAGRTSSSTSPPSSGC